MNRVKFLENVSGQGLQTVSLKSVLQKGKNDELNILKFPDFKVFASCGQTRKGNRKAHKGQKSNSLQPTFKMKGVLIL